MIGRDQTEMGIHIGLDIGAISLKLAALGNRKTVSCSGSLRGEAVVSADQWKRCGWQALPLLLSEYRRIAGSPIQSTYDMLQEIYDSIPEEQIRASASPAPAAAPSPGFWASTSRTSSRPSRG